MRKFAILVAIERCRMGNSLPINQTNTSFKTVPIQTLLLDKLVDPLRLIHPTF